MRDPRDDGSVRWNLARRVAVIAVSHGLAASTTLFAIDAFGGSPVPKMSQALSLDGSRSNGSIYFRYEDNQGRKQCGTGSQAVEAIN